MLGEDEKKWSLELERRKRKIIEEEQNKLNDFNTFRRSLLIFSHIFRIAPKLKRLSKRTRKRLKQRALYLNQQKPKSDNIDLKIKPKQSPTHPVGYHPYHNLKSEGASRKVPEELLQAYMAKLKKRV